MHTYITSTPTTPYLLTKIIGQASLQFNSTGQTAHSTSSACDIESETVEALEGHALFFLGFVNYLTSIVVVVSV